MKPTSSRSTKPSVSYLFDRINLPVDFGVDFRDRTVSNAIQTGSYKSEAHLFAANITISF